MLAAAPTARPALVPQEVGAARPTWTPQSTGNAGLVGAHWDDVERAAWTLSEIMSPASTCGAYGRGAETVLPVRSAGVYDRILLHTARA